MRKIKEYIKKNTIIIGLVVTLIIGVLLRFKGLTFQSYWLDELFSATISNPVNSFSYMHYITVADVHPPLYQSLLWGWYHIFGFNEYAGRSLSALIGSISIFAIYVLGKELFNKEVGLYAAIIASMNSFLIFYSQEVRSFSLLFLFSMISYIYLIKVLMDYSKKNFILYLLSTVALVYVHYFGFFLVATQVFVFIYFFIEEKNKRKLLTILAVITATVIITSLLPLMEYILKNTDRASFWIGMPSNWFALDYMRGYLNSQYLEGIFLLIISFSLVYLFKKVENKKFKSMIIVLLLWIIIGYLLPYIRSITAIPLLTSRNTIMIIPALILLISYGIYLLKDTLLKITTIGVIVFFSLYQLNQTHYYSKATKEQWREVLVWASKSVKKIPAYDYMDFYPAYRTMLNLDMDVDLGNNVKTKFENGTLEECFFALDAHSDNISKDKTLQNNSIKKVLETRKYAARGILYAYNVPTKTCLDLYNGGAK